MSLTEFHFVLLFRDRVIGVGNLNEALVYDEAIPLVGDLFRNEPHLI